jgi:hypothetical protein
MGPGAVWWIEPTSGPLDPCAFHQHSIVDGPCPEAGGHGAAFFEPADGTLKNAALTRGRSVEVPGPAPSPLA